jgi:hypothetical protein
MEDRWPNYYTSTSGGNEIQKTSRQAQKKMKGLMKDLKKF